MRLIDADALDKAFTDLRWSSEQTLAHWGDRKDWCLHGSEIEKLIEDAPTIDPVKHGRWIPLNDQIAKCSSCGAMESTFGKDRTGHALIHKAIKHYCPNCGAKMDEDGDAE